MKMNEKWLNEVMRGISEKSVTLGQVVLTNRLYKELETKSLEQVFIEHLPVSDTAELKADASDIHNAIEKMYNGFDEQVNELRAEAYLNKALDGYSCNEQGKCLVNFLICAASVKPDGFEENSRWKELKTADSFQQEDIADLMAMVHQCIENSAGFLARQEFLVMEHSLENLSHKVVETQMNSGIAYAHAYAAAMYITNKHQDIQQEITPYEIGLLAANSVESSCILAQYHYGKLRLEEVFFKLKACAKYMLAAASEMLLQAAALGFRLLGSYGAGKIAFNILTYFAVANTSVLWAVPLGLAAAAFFACSQEEAVEFVTAIWNDIKSMVDSIIQFFKGNGGISPAASVVEAAVVDETPQSLPLYVDNIII